MRSGGCPTCHAVRHLLIEAEPDVVRRGVEARAKGPGWGVLVAVPEELGAETPEEVAALETARELGYFAGVASVETLIRFVPGDGHDPDELAAIVRQLCRPPPEGQIHVLAVLDGCVATVTAHASAAMVAERDADAARLARIGELLGLAEPEIVRRAAESRRPRSLFVVTAPEDPMVRRLGADSASTREAAARGSYVGLHDAADVIAALPLEGLEADEGTRAARRLTSAIPEGDVRIVAVHAGHITIVTRPPEPGCCSLD